MSTEKRLALDMSLENTVRQLLPRPPLLSSYPLGWEDLYLQYHQQSPGETPEITMAHHSLLIHHREHDWFERKINGKRHREPQQVGHIAIVPAGADHQSRWHQDLEFTALFLEPNYVKQIAYESIDPDRIEILPQLSAPDPLIYQISLALKQELETNRLGNRLYVDSLKTMLTATLLKNYSAKKPLLSDRTNTFSPSRLKQAIEYIDANLAKDLSLAEIAAVVHVSPYHFARMFKQETGLSPHQYVLRHRIIKAKQLLINPNHPLLKISQQVGFDSQSHFIKVFRKYTGTTPKNYRKEIC
jgi:AraC family transcriptional regulator